MIARVYPLVTARAVDQGFDYTADAEVTRGALVEVELGARTVRGVVTEVAAGDGEGLKPVLGVVGSVPEPLLALAEWIAASYASTLSRAVGLVLPPAAGTRAPEPWVRLVTMEGASRRQAEVLAHVGLAPLPLSDLVAAAGTTRDTVRRMADRGLVALDPAPQALVDDVRVTLTPEQEGAVAACVETLDGGGGDVLVHGVTGSGKTEVYLRVIDAALARGRGAIVLVPEIALTPQTAARFTARFGPTVAVLHSGISPARRGAEHARVAAGEARVVVGARSAVFAAVPDLGVIAVDEEHDASYKHEADPRYDARRVAAKRGRLEGAVVIYGTATPRPESWAGIPRRLSLPSRVGGPLPAVEIVDLRADGGYPLTRPLIDALAAIDDRGGRAILLQNRRGAASAIHCRTCGRTWRCPRCDVSLVLHGRRLVCHHCGLAQPLPRACATCGSVDLAHIGAGTARVEDDLRARYPRLEVMRLDADIAARPGEPEATLRAFRRANAAVLVGTQLVAKGHDMPGVSVAAVLDADLALAIPDFRAEERTFGLLTQLAGRPGRPGDPRGRVLIQTWSPELRPVVLAARHAVGEFLEGELERRRDLGYPPFRRLVRVLTTADSAGLAHDVAATIAEAATPALEDDIVLGPAPLQRLRDRSRSHVLIKTSTAGRAAAVLRGLLRDLAADLRRVRATAVVDVDPQSFG
ncbi:MAG TPA: primosomal protein N' [Gaiellales bacterium]|nr:primosomal protein N' [Gaiellales bacterium]